VKRRPKAGVDKSCLARGGIFVSFVFFVIFVFTPSARPAG